MNEINMKAGELPPLPAPDVIAYSCVGDNDAYSPMLVERIRRDAIADDRRRQSDMGIPASGPQAAQGVKDHEIRELVNTLRDVAVQYRDAQQLRSRIQDVVLPVFERAQLARQSQCEAIGYVALDDLETLAKTPRKPIREGDYLRMYLTPFTEHQRATKPLYAAPPLSSEQQAEKGAG